MRKVHQFTRYGCIGLGLLTSFGVRAGETIEYVAEHLLEAPINAQSLSYPLVPLNDRAAEPRLQLGYSSFRGEKLKVGVPMLGVSYFAPVSARWGLLASAFYDKYRISGDKGATTGGVRLIDMTELPKRFDAVVTDVRGSGRYAGASVSLALLSDSTWTWQFGMATAVLDVERFDVDFDTVSLATNLSATFDYRSRYRINTVFARAELKSRNLIGDIEYRPHLMIAVRFPRVAFDERVYGAGFDHRSDVRFSGTHIPDEFIGLGVSLESRRSGISVDLGATLYMYAFEPVFHKGISTPLFVTLSVPLGSTAR